MTTGIQFAGERRVVAQQKLIWKAIPHARSAPIQVPLTAAGVTVQFESVPETRNRRWPAGWQDRNGITMWTLQIALNKQAKMVRSSLLSQRHESLPFLLAIATHRCNSRVSRPVYVCLSLQSTLSEPMTPTSPATTADSESSSDSWAISSPQQGSRHKRKRTTANNDVDGEDLVPEEGETQSDSDHEPAIQVECHKRQRALLVSRTALSSETNGHQIEYGSDCASDAVDRVCKSSIERSAGCLEQPKQLEADVAISLNMGQDAKQLSQTVASQQVSASASETPATALPQPCNLDDADVLIGRGHPRSDMDNAHDKLSAAAATGNLAALNRVYMMLDGQSSLIWLEWWAHKGDEHAQQRLCKVWRLAEVHVSSFARHCWDHKKLLMTAKWHPLRKKADEGDASAQHVIARFLILRAQDLDSRGRGLTCKETCQIALEWYTKAALQGFAQAQFDLANLKYRQEAMANLPHRRYFSKETLSWYTKAAEQGHAGALRVLGYMHYGGAVTETGEVRCDWTKASTLLKQVVLQESDDDVLCSLVNMYTAGGNGLVADIKEAVYHCSCIGWYKRRTAVGYIMREYQRRHAVNSDAGDQLLRLIPTEMHAELPEYVQPVLDRVFKRPPKHAWPWLRSPSLNAESKKIHGRPALSSINARCAQLKKRLTQSPSNPPPNLAVSRVAHSTPRPRVDVQVKQRSPTAAELANPYWLDLYRPRKSREESRE